MKQMPFCDNWTCKHLNADEPPIPVRIPDDAMLREPRTEKSMGGLNVGWFEGRDYSYKKTFSLTGEQLSGALLLEFEGVYRKAEVYVNGEKAAFRPYGYTNFYVDLKPYVHVGVNEIEVRAFNADQPNSRWYSGAGIYRPVRLWTAPEQHIEINSVKIRTLSLDPATVEVTVKTTGDGIVKVELLDGETAIASASGEERTFSLTVENVTPWSADTPKLYTCRVTYGADEAVESFGFRTLAWGKDGLLVNGKREILRGACVHHDNGLLGAKCEPDALERRIRILKENGYNALRSAHNPCSKTALEICDRLGMYVMDEYIDHWYIHASPELRSKKQLIESFIAGINNVDDVMTEWRSYVAEEKERELVQIIQDENLNEEATRKFVSDSFRNGEVKTTGTDIDKLMPPTSRFGGGNRAAKKLTIIDKLKAFFERFFGIV